MGNSLTYAVKVSWQYERGLAIETRAVLAWNEICARIMERFGLPGGRYTTEVTSDYMIFHFNTAEDALVAKLMVGDDGSDNSS